MIVGYFRLINNLCYPRNPVFLGLMCSKRGMTKSSYLISELFSRHIIGQCEEIEEGKVTCWLENCTVLAKNFIQITN
jgi:hypothetical protein